MLDVRTGVTGKGAVLLVEDERITAVGSGLAIPTGTKVIDLGAMTVLPGLIDCHTHLMMRLGPEESYASGRAASSRWSRSSPRSAFR